MRTLAGRWLVFLALPFLAAAASSEPRHGIAMHGAPKYPPGFSHFDYVNPDAPKGGAVAFGVQGSFDSFNPFIVKGNAVAAVRDYVYESLLTRSYDEPFSLYGLLAESVEMPDDRSWVAFELHPQARFSDGVPVTPDDVIASHALLRDKGRPNFRSYYSKVERIERIGERKVKFIFKGGGDRELPLILGLMPILPRHKVSAADLDLTSLVPPVGSGPYKITAAEPGASVTLQRDAAYWGRELPVNRGHYNFDTLRFEFYRDRNSMFEAFKKGLFHILTEADPGRWARDYDFPAVRDGRVAKQGITLGIPGGMSALVFNTRRPLFADKRVRQALNLLFDFEWINKSFYHGLYLRTQSYFDGSELAAHGRPADAEERRLLAPYAGIIAPEIMEGKASQPVTDASGRNRENRRLALELLEAAGYGLVNGRLVHRETAAPFAFEMLSATRDQERLFLTYARALETVGIKVQIRQVDSAQYQARKTAFDFDVIQNSWAASLSPGNEQNFRWSTAAAESEGSFNYAGVKSPAADAMIAAMLAADERGDFVSAVRALDRVLMSGSYVVPLYRAPQQWVAYWTKLVPAPAHTLYGFRIDTWWMREADRQAAARAR